jgi:hypothetical protein
MENYVKRLQKFYIEDFEDIIKKYRRGPTISMALKWIYQMQLISLMFSFELEKMIFSKSDVALLLPVKKVLDSFKIFPLIEFAMNV